jgi:hypothetical protein
LARNQSRTSRWNASSAGLERKSIGGSVVAERGAERQASFDGVPARA